MICFCLFKTRPTAPRVEMGRRTEVGAEGPGLLSLKHVIPACPDYPGFTPQTSGPRGLAAQQPGQSPLYLWLLGSGTRASSERSGDRQQPGSAGFGLLQSRFRLVGLAFHRLKASYLCEHSLLAPLSAVPAAPG